MASNHLKSFVGSSRLVWIFPIIVLLTLVLLTVFKISGSSIGIYSMLNGVEDSNMLVGAPRGVRSDEWLVNSQMIIAQSKNGFKRVNTNIGNGQDMSVVGDAPYREWSAVFKPQNLVFLVLPLEHAFAFKWWSIGALLVLVAYFLSLELFPKKILRSVLLASIIGLTPMMIWWYSPGIILCIAYSLLAMFMAIRLINSASHKSKLGCSLLLAYVLACFALILYPPFQIPCLLIVGAFVLGWWLEDHANKPNFKKLLALWPYLLLVIVLVASAIGTFYFTRRDVIETVTNTVYPGSRVELSGGADPLLPLSSFLSPNLQYDAQASSGYYNNQSEASNFIFIAPYLFIPSLFLIIRQKKKTNKTLWGLVIVNLALACFMIRMYVSTPWLEPFYRLLLLDKVPSTRFLLAIGFTGFLQLLLLVKALDGIKLKAIEKWLLALVGGLSSLAVMLVVGNYSIGHFPGYIASFSKVVVFSLWISLAVFLILYKRFLLGLALIAAFSLLSVYRIHPLYRGLDVVTSSRITDAIAAYPNDGNWVVLNNRLIINFPLMAGEHSLNSVELYPQLELWHQLDTARQYEAVYNRYAHVVFTDDPLVAEPLKLQHADTFLVKFEPCKDFLQTHAKYVLATKQVNEPCTQLQEVINHPAQSYYIYRITSP